MAFLSAKTLVGVLALWWLQLGYIVHCSTIQGSQAFTCLAFTCLGYRVVPAYQSCEEIRSIQFRLLDWLLRLSINEQSLQQAAQAILAGLYRGMSQMDSAIKISRERDIISQAFYSKKNVLHGYVIASCSLIRSQSITSNCWRRFVRPAFRRSTAPELNLTNSCRAAFADYCPKKIQRFHVGVVEVRGFWQRTDFAWIFRSSAFVIQIL